MYSPADFPEVRYENTKIYEFYMKGILGGTAFASLRQKNKKWQNDIKNIKEISVKIKFAYISLKTTKILKISIYFKYFKEIQAKIRFAYILLNFLNEYVILSSRLGGMIWKRH